MIQKYLNFYITPTHIQYRIWIALFVRFGTFISLKSHMLVKSYCLLVFLVAR